MQAQRMTLREGKMTLHADPPHRILEFLASAGVETLLGEEPVNRLAPPAKEPAAGAVPVIHQPESEARVSPAAAPAAPDDAAMTARQLAASAPDLDTLRGLLDTFDGCALKSMATRLVFADGNPEGRVMIIGEAPGRDEDEVGRPFVGRAGQLLDKMLSAIGLDRTQVYIANIVPWRPPGNRTPTPQEIAICLPFIQRQIELAAPDVLITMGAPATQNLLGQREGILRLRGRWFDYHTGGHDRPLRTIPSLATLHPAYLLRQPAQKALAWRDLRALKARLEQD